MRTAPGSHSGLELPADLPTLLALGPAWLTRAFGTEVTDIVAAQEFSGGGTGRKALLTVAYAQPGLPEHLFVKFSRDFDDELRDSQRASSVSEVRFARLSRTPGFPVPVPLTLFADIDPETSTGLIVSERIPYGRDGVEPAYVKCRDYEVPDQVGHYRAILEGLAVLAGADRAGRLPAEFAAAFPRSETSPAAFLRLLPEEQIFKRANRFFDFVERYPRLFPAELHGFRAEFVADIPDVLAAADRIAAVLGGNADFFAFSHWNANIDNCWFFTENGRLRAGFVDWTNAAPTSVAQAVSGALSGAETFVWAEHLDELVAGFVAAYSAHGGPALDPAEVRQHLLLGTAASFPHLLGAPIALPREVADLDAVTDSRDPALAEHENARIQLHMGTRLLSTWRAHRIGDLVRAL